MVVWEVRENPPVATPVEIFTGSPQLYTVPAGTFVGTALKVEPLHIVVVILLTTGTGFTTIVTT